MEETATKEQLSGPMGKGTESRNWVTELKVPPIYRQHCPVTVKEDMAINMKDGIVLRGRLFLPELPQGERCPCIVLANGYGHINQPREDGLSRYLATHGYAVLHISLRGSGTSGGNNTLFNKYGEDGYELVEWMAKQPWSDGSVGMVGQSLRGISQWQTAKQLPPSLKAISPEIACSDCYDYMWYPGGMLPGPGRAARGEPEYPSATEHPNFDEWWHERSVLDEDMKTIVNHDITALISGGWNDYIIHGTLKSYIKFKAAGGKSKLIVGAGAHHSVQNLLPYDFKDYQVLWFDRYLLGLHNGVDKDDNVLVYIQGPNKWRYEKDWPIPDTHLATLYLTNKLSESIKSVNDGSLDASLPKERQSSVKYSYSPISGPFLPTMRSNKDGILRIDQQSFEEKAITWTTGPLSIATEVTGEIIFTFWAESTSEDTDFVVEITDVAPDGKSRQVTSGYLNASRAKSRSNPRRITPGLVEQYVIEMIPTSYVFTANHRIRLSLAGGSMALKEQVGPQGPGLNPNPSTVTVYLDVNYPSNLKLPLIGVSSLQTI
ncbi:CocE/NonD family hydrolase [Paenibacillus sp. LMG 31456]|uniref:CocE/NonD family hydrolase n=1 Tax=Paenibacillus foliorum TaxID=2654974 RepID=A0A972K106_9BACL|nr:CocE/NonD family hydrolase [Paenibacillus foliorum]NOU96189.1 CocE/NonD family hydrolase [Paenibacillus foliorum]